MKNTSILKRAIALVLSSAVSLSLCSCDFSDYTEQTSASTSESTRSTQSTSRTTQTTATTRTTKTTATTETTSTTQKPPKQEEILTYNIVSERYKTNSTSYGSVYMECCIVIENTGNKNLYIDGTDLDIEDAEGNLIDTKKDINAYPDVIAPGERSVIYDIFSFDGNSDETYYVITNFDIRKATVPIERLEVSDVSVKQDEYGTIKVLGRVKNTTEETQSLYKTTIILYNANNEVLSVIYTYPDELEPGQKTSFSASDMVRYGEINYSDIDHWDAFAFTLQWQFD